MSAKSGNTATSPSGDVELPLRHDPEAVEEARRRTRTVLAGWRLPTLVDTVCLAVSELVTNAIKHGHPPIALRLRRRDDGVRIDVRDGTPAEPKLPASSSDDEAISGRGLAIVAALADEIGCEQVPDDGKIVYAEFSVGQPAPS